jgi:HlyD family secretion protein
MIEPAATTSGPPMNTSGVAIEQLDTLVRVTSVQAWVSLGTLFAVCVGAILSAFFYRVPKKVVGEGILLIKHDRLSQVRALGTGRLMKLDVTLGAKVAPDDEIGQIYQQDLGDAIRETEARLKQLRDENARLIQFEADEQTAQERAISKLKGAIDRIIENSKQGLRVAVKIVQGSERLQLISQLSNLDYLKDLQQKYTIQNDLNNGQSRLAELELTKLSSDNLRKRARLQRELEISKLEMKLLLDREKRDRTSRIVSHVQGTVTQILTAADEYVREGAPVVLLSSPKGTVPVPDFNGPYDCIVFVPAGEGKKIEVGHFVEVMPATIKREEHGFIHGEVVAVSDLPATRLAMEAALQHPDLVETFLKRYAPGVLLRVHVRLERREGLKDDEANEIDPDDHNQFHWSSSSGEKQKLKTGTLCEAAIVVEKHRLITLVVPWMKKLMDLH